MIWSTVEQAAAVGFRPLERLMRSSARLLIIVVPVLLALILVSMAVGASYDENSRKAAESG